MTFSDALNAVFNDNARIRRHIWNSSIYCLLDDEKLCIHGHASQGADDGKNHPWVISSEDYFADDWEVME